MKYRWPISLFILLVVATSCAPKVPFTQSVRQSYKLTVEELKSLQFYTSREIVLVKNEEQIREKSTNKGTLAVRNGTSLEQVVIPAGTPCVVTKVIDGEQMALQFGPAPTAYLVFGTLTNNSGYYALQTRQDAEGRPVVSYNNETYTVRSAPRDIILLFKMKGIQSTQQQQKVVSGKRL